MKTIEELAIYQIIPLLVATFARSGYCALRSLGVGGQKKSESESECECESNHEHFHFFFLQTHSHTHTLKCSVYFPNNL